MASDASGVEQHLNVAQWLQRATESLSEAGVATARLDALVLLEFVTEIDRAKLLAEPEMTLSDEQLRALKKVLVRRLSHEPIAYILGHTEFFGRNFVVSAKTLEPRPESETMIEVLKSLPDLPAEPRIADVGAGSGALGITALLELQKGAVELLEIDPDAVQIAKTNVDLLTPGILVFQSDLLASGTGNYDVLLCNLPYVPDAHTINRAATFEPKIAIFGGPDGLDLYRKLFEQLKNVDRKPLYILTESLPPQHEALAVIAAPYGYELVRTDDFIQLFRYQ